MAISWSGGEVLQWYETRTVKHCKTLCQSQERGSQRLVITNLDLMGVDISTGGSA